MTVRADDPMTGVTVHPVGGLGNQLFSYACGRAVATRLECPLYVDVGGFGRQPADETPRSFALDWLIDPARGVVTTSSPPQSRLLRAARRRFGGLMPSSEFHERSFAYDARILSVRRGVSLKGYFQSWRYFEAIATELRAELTSRAPASAWFREQRSHLGGRTPWIAVHVRRGDYTLAKNVEFHGLLGPDYYRQSLEAMKARLPNARVVLFSDDPGSAVELITPIHSIDHVVVPPPEVHAMESIALMGHASALVIANSSFSWWGAWLADPELTPVAAPSPWFSGAHVAEGDLCPPQWLRLPASLTT